MKRTSKARFPLLSPLLQFFACAASVCLCTWLYDLATGTHVASWPEWWPLEIGILIVTCWIAITFFDDHGPQLRSRFDQFFTAVGFMLLVQYGLAYFFYFKLLPWSILLGGCALAVAFSTLLLTALEDDSATQRILLLGFDSSSYGLASVLHDRIVGVIGNEPAGVALGLPFLGTVGQLSQAVAEHRPECVIVSDGDRRVQVRPRQLLRLRYAGITVESGNTFYENVFSRVNSSALSPFELLFSSAFMASPAAMAIQAVYTNIIALGLLLIFSPLLVLIAILIRISSGDKVLERIECPGFQQIPFRLLRFRVRDRKGERLWIGDLISRLRLVNLPQLINVARGEMTLVGPPPARCEFARRLSSIMPVYGHRFTVRPGIIGWSQINLRNIPIPDERLRLEYDLYYVKQGSPSMDLDIFFRTMFRISASPELTLKPTEFWNS